MTGKLGNDVFGGLNSIIGIAGIQIPKASLPDFKAEMRRGETKYKVTVTANAPFIDAQILVCEIGNQVVVDVGPDSWLGTVYAFGVREGHSVLQLENATLMSRPMT